MGLFERLFGPATCEDFGPGPGPVKGLGREPVIPDYMREFEELAAAWDEYDKARARLIEEAKAAKPDAEFQIVRHLDGVWQIQRWSPDAWGDMFLGLRGISKPYRAPTIHPGYSSLNDLQFKSQQEAQLWLHEFLHPEERTFAYDADGKPIDGEK